MNDLRHLENIVRVASVFVATILLPAVLLALMALTSIRSEELLIDEELRARATAIVRQVAQEHAKVFERFEASTTERLLAAESPLNNIRELSPHLRAAFRFDQAGALAAPFHEAAPPPLTEPTVAYRKVRALAARAAQDERWLDAAALHMQSAQSTLAPAHAAAGYLAAARALDEAGSQREAEDLLAQVYGEYANVRDPRGHRFGDLALLKRAEIRLARSPDIGSSALEDLVDQLLGSYWSIERAGEPAIARRALQRLDGLSNKEWLGRARTRLNERTEQLYWASLVRNDLGSLHENTSYDGFRYVGARNAWPALWATVRHGDTYAFSFSVESIFAELVHAAKLASDLDDDLVAELLGPDDLASDAALATASLGPQLPIARVSVRLFDQARLAELKQRRSNARQLVIATALIMVVFGVLLSARIIGREIETARVKADFAANVSHELRSPLTQIRLKGEALQLGLVEEADDLQQHYDAIVNEAERLSRLIDNVLDFAAIERGAKRYHLRKDDIREVVYTAVEATRSAFDQRGIDLECDLSEAVPPVYIDREAIKQVLVNLLSNAAKYGSDGKWVGVSVRSAIDSVDVSVADRGMGIAPDEIDRVFDDFFRSTHASVRSRKGTGVGLSIVRYIVDAHGGSVAVDSTPGRGATFTVTLPLDPPEGAGART
jgi:signal transduction histidine kinase